MRAISKRAGGWWGVAIPVLAAMLMLGQVAGQDKPTSKPAVKADKKEKSGGRLPAYYGQVVSKEQRTKIYDIQAKYADQIKKLRDQIMTLEKQQTDEVTGVLSTEQRDQIAKMVADAKAKRSKKSDAESTSTGDEDSGK